MQFFLVAAREEESEELPSSVVAGFDPNLTFVQLCRLELMI